MKNIYLAFLFLCASCSLSYAQNAADYSYSTLTDVALVDMSSGSTQLFGTMEDEGSSQVITMPFSFDFHGTTYNQFSVSTNGLVGLGSTPVTDFYIASTLPCGSYPVLMAWGEDLTTDVNGWIKYKVDGQVGSRKIVIDWMVKTYSDDGPAANKHFQVWLLEGTNDIQFVYGDGFTDWYNGSTIGIATSDDDYKCVYSTDHSSSTSTVCFWNDTWPGENVSYVFSPFQEIQPVDRPAASPIVADLLSLPAKNNLKVYPNPASGLFKVELNATVASKVKVQVLNNAGRMIMQQVVIMNNNSQILDINLGQQIPGTYFVKVITDNSVQTRKISIVR